MASETLVTPADVLEALPQLCRLSIIAALTQLEQQELDLAALWPKEASNVHPASPATATWFIGRAEESARRSQS